MSQRWEGIGGWCVRRSVRRQDPVFQAADEWRVRTQGDQVKDLLGDLGGVGIRNGVDRAPHQ